MNFKDKNIFPLKKTFNIFFSSSFLDRHFSLHPHSLIIFCTPKHGQTNIHENSHYFKVQIKRIDTWNGQILGNILCTDERTIYTFSLVFGFVVCSPSKTPVSKRYWEMICVQLCWYSQPNWRKLESTLINKLREILQHYSYNVIQL